MHWRITLRDTVRVPPHRFGEPLEKVVKELLQQTYEGVVDKDVGMVVAILEVKEIGVGRIIMGDGASYHEVVFEALTYRPELGEVVLGEVVEVVSFGSFVRVGPMDALLHISQVMDDYVSYDEKKGALVGKETGKSLKEGDRLRARVVSVSLKRDYRGKVGLTMRQPGLGKLEWLEEGSGKGGKG
ncbi:MAG: DNA-directed RNA polymerase [Hadesarchaea archaeon]|nr:DNA-directed RNA polymerase [Hadesarchaea archaeon]TDA30008.1 MAG: DNA-directed RNA polymerase [Hadesarchaea archaeon]